MEPGAQSQEPTKMLEPKRIRMIMIMMMMMMMMTMIFFFVCQVAMMR